METLKKRLGNLLAVKSIATIVLTAVFAFYFGTQAEKKAQVDNGNGTGTT